MRTRDTITIARWRLQNRRRSVKPTNLAPPLDAVGKELTGNGVAIASFEQVFGSTDLLKEALEEADRLPRRHDPPSKEEFGEGKSLQRQLLTDTLSMEDVWLRIALHPNVLAIANHYLKMRSLLRAVQIWQTFPTSGPTRLTQLWHRDQDDLMNVKLLIHLNDVGKEQGPFCYASGTHPLGQGWLARGSDYQRMDDDDFARATPPDNWVVCSGGSGTVVFADTCGYHKQLKPEAGERLLLAAQFTSGTPVGGQAVRILGDELPILTPEQRDALTT